jgi:type VII secretion protein EccB
VANKKDLVEAYSFSRRRLVTAFVSGAPGGREVEPARPGRTVVGGLALAVLLAAGAAIAGVFSPQTPDDWNQPGLLISKETGAAYVITQESEHPELRPVINSTSAKLILGAEAEPTLISQDTIDDQHIGEDIGIFGAPASLPTSSLLIDSGWTACTATGHGVRVTVSESPDLVPTPDMGVPVKVGGELYVIAQAARTGDAIPGAYVYPVPKQVGSDGGDRRDALLASFKLQDSGSATEVSREWLNLFPTGDPLDWSTFKLARFDKAPSTPTPEVDDAKVGDLLDVADGSHFVVTDDGPAQISDFAAGAYRNIITPNGAPPTVLPIDAVPGTKFADPILTETHWPAALDEQIPGDPCVQLTAEHGKAPLVQLTSPGDATAVGDVDEGKNDQVVDAGRGAYVLSGDWTDRDSGLPFVIDSKGQAYPLVGQGVAGLLGYGDHPVSVVPDSWIDLFGCGVNLSEDAALSPPSDEDDRTCTT